MITPHDAQLAFQNAMPSRRAAFAKFRESRRLEFHRSSDFRRLWPKVALELAEDELRQRVDLARGYVQKLIDSGWVPTQMDTISTVFQSCFTQYKDADKNPLDDLYRSVRSCFSEVGVSDTEVDHYEYLLGKTNVHAAESAVSDLKMHVPIIASKAMTVNVYGNTAIQQFGDHASASAIQNIGAVYNLVIDAVDKIRTALPLLPIDERDETEQHIETIESEVTSTVPRHGKIRAALSAIRRGALPLLESTAKAALEVAIEAALKQIGPP